MSKFSVKKPFTILVMVASLIMLGYVSLTKMQMDLLPEINLPYVIVITTYPGASPEKIESTVSEPMESGLGTISGVKNIYSFSYENYSMVELEFEDDTDMDSVLVKISTALDTVKAYLPEECGTPTIMELSTDMVASEYFAVSYEGKDITELSAFVEDTVTPEFERLDGVADVTTTGMIEQTVSLELDQKKVDKLNDKILGKANEALDDALEEIEKAKGDLEKAQSDLNEGKQELRDKENELNDSVNDINDGQKELEDAKKDIEEGKKELKDKEQETYKELADASEAMEALKTYEAQLVSQEANLKATEIAIKTIEDKLPSSSEEQKLEQAITDMEGAISGLDGAVSSLEDCKTGIIDDDDDTLTDISKGSLGGARAIMDGINSMMSAMEGMQEIPVSQDSMDDMTGSAAKSEIDGYINALSSLKSSLKSQKSKLESTKSGLNSARDLRERYKTEKASMELEIQVTKGIIEKYEQNLEELGVSYTSIEEAKMQASKEFASAEAEIKDGENTIEATQKQLESAMDTIDSAREQLTSGWDQLEDGQKQIDEGWEQYYEGLDEFEKQREKALKSANADALLTLDTLANLVYAQNFEMPAGYIEDEDSNSWLLKIGDNFETLDELKSMVLCNIDGVGDVRLEDVANITIIDNSDTTYTRLNGQDAIVLSIFKASTAGTNDVSKVCDKAIERLEEKYNGLHLLVMVDQGDYIDMIVGNVVSNMVIGAALAILILAIFLKDFMPTIVVAISIPLSVLTAIVAMYFSGISLNIMSLSGMALGIGMLVDNSIVVIENIYRLRGRGVEAPRAAVQGTRQVAGSVISSTLTTVCVFVPMVYTTGLVRELMLPMSLTIIYCLLASLFIAMTVVPAASSTLLRKAKPKKHPIFDKVQDAYGVVLRFFLKIKIVPLSIAIGLLALSVWLVLRMGIVVIPNMVTNQIQATVTFEEDTERQTAYSEMDKYIEKLNEIDGVASVAVMTGQGTTVVAADTQDDFLTYSIMITTEDENAGAGIVEAISDGVLEKAAGFENMEVKLSNGMDGMGELLGSGLSIKIYGSDVNKLLEISNDIMDIVDGVEGFTEISNGQQDADQVMHLNIDKDYAMSKGLSVAQIYQELVAEMTTEKESISVVIDDREMDVEIVNNLNPITVENLMDYTFEYTEKNDDGEEETKETKLKDFASLEMLDGYSSISRENQTRYITVTASVEDGYNTTLLSRELAPLLEEYDVPDGYSIDFGGESESVNEMITQMGLLMIMGIAFIYFVMVAQFQSLLSPFIVLFTLPLAFTGGLLILWATGEQISIIAIMGFIVLLGTVVNNGIVFVDYTNQLRKGGMERRDALVATGKTRMRPILMTALTTILAEASMIFGDDMGSQMGRGMALVIAGGLAYSTLMTLFIIPVMYDILFKKKPLDVDLGSENLDDVPDDAKEFMEEMLRKKETKVDLSAVYAGANNDIGLNEDSIESSNISTLEETAGEGSDVNSLEEAKGEGQEMNPHKEAQGDGQEMNALKEAQGDGQEMNALKEDQGDGQEMNALEEAQGEDQE